MHPAAFEESNVGESWLVDVECSGSESLLFDCDHSDWEELNCERLKEAVVICKNG